MKCAQPTRAPEKKRAGVADPGAGCGSRTGSGWWHGAIPYFFDEI